MILGVLHLFFLQFSWSTLLVFLKVTASIGKCGVIKSAGTVVGEAAVRGRKLSFGGFHFHGESPKWLVYKSENTIDDFQYHRFRKPLR